MKVEYYFSVLSPFSYLGADRFTKIVSKYNLEVIEKPLDLVGEIFPNTGGLPVPKRHPARQKYRLVELERISNKLGLPIIKKPKFFPPKDPHLPAKFVIASNKLGNKLHFGNECLKYLWSMDKDLSDHNTLQEICESCEDVTEIHDHKLSEHLRDFKDNKGMKYNKYNLEFFGLCKKCV